MIDLLNAAARKVPSWVLYIVAALYPTFLFYQGLTGGLGVDPVKAMEHEMGRKGLQVLILTLSITPLRRYLGVNFMKFRRATGLIAFFYIGLHLLVWLVLDVQIPSEIWADILKRPYVTIGMVGFIVLLPLAITSNNWSVRRLGRNWHVLHKLTYVAIVLGAVHFLMLAKGFQYEPIIYLVVVAFLLALRLIPRRRLVRA
ncbi:protein-methionine-sulfoxide reductase heme-binding subunit MsrQ [Shimia abyssi]|uniref:Protein-methionine-sulfoxide reductase heme-binding subunit MsrQ n=1 Tax=Shimia abyssi TaxID=1662395 RepID=A0A2P8F9K0_9RHOB|nr:protein-methionine-sulfoxide reductase heme-binding subunit MsrQ [Shimia abyssi]PSL18390.1 sulfoxide reductase heme-binding subunit YedZ [Shimia abyssi]